MKQPEQNKQHVFVYCDESRQVQSRHMLIGGLWIPQDVESDFLSACAEYRTRLNMTAELKWTKVSRTKLDAYKQFVDLYFQTPTIRFRCIVIDTHKVDYHKYHEGDKELGFYKFYYQFLSRNIKAARDYQIFHKNTEYWLYTDQIQNRSSNRLQDLKQHLNIRYTARVVEPIDSHKSDPLQMVDVLLGAIGYGLEGYNTSPAKVEMLSYIKRVAQIPSLRTYQARRDFNVWHFRLRP